MFLHHSSQIMNFTSFLHDNFSKVNLQLDVAIVFFSKFLKSHSTVSYFLNICDFEAVKRKIFEILRKCH